MNPSLTKPASLPADVDMHIGPTFDPEKYLEMERKLFKVELRPIPHHGKPEILVPAEQAILSGFLQIATIFACWLDDVLKAPFKAFSSRSTPSAHVGSESVRLAPEPNQKREITPPPRADPAKTMESRQYSLQKGLGHAAKSEGHGELRKGSPPQACQERSGVVKNGRVKDLIKKFEDWSDVTVEGSSKQSNEIAFSDRKLGHAKANGKVPQKMVTQEGVANPTNVASTSSMMTKPKARARDVRSGGRVTFCGNENASHGVDTDNCRNRAGRRNANVERRRSARRGSARRGSVPTFWRMCLGGHNRS